MTRLIHISGEDVLRHGRQGGATRYNEALYILACDRDLTTEPGWFAYAMDEKPFRKASLRRWWFATDHSELLEPFQVVNQLHGIDVRDDDFVPIRYVALPHRAKGYPPDIWVGVMVLPFDLDLMPIIRGIGDQP